MKYQIAKALLQLLWLLLLSPPLVLSRVLVQEPMPVAGPPPGCPSMCGDIDIPYPFGIGDGCSKNKDFAISCNNSYNPARAFIGRGFEVKNITLETGEMRVFTGVAHICYNSSNTISSIDSWKYDFTGSSFLISSARNEFTGVGCNTVALLTGEDMEDDGRYLSGCITTCASLGDAADDVNCTGNGCCQTATPEGLDTVTVGWNTLATNTAWNYSSCSTAFLAEKGWYNFSLNHLDGTGETSFHKQLGIRTVPLVLDWAMKKDGACLSANSTRVHVRNGLWYRCKCSDGYAGNPYVVGGCENIDECKLLKSDPETYGKQYHLPSGSKCVDTDGSYEVKCNFGRIGSECRLVFSATVAAVPATLVASLLLVLLRKEHKRRMRSGFFDKNGGQIMKSMNMNTFTELELENITNHYDTPIGKGAFGKVYRGTTHENLRVAVKRSIVEGMKPSHDHDLVNEIAIQFQVSHANLVRLIGCCLETDVPMLVFEYVSNGSLYNVLHCGSTPRALPLSARLDIAIGSAKALAYMHSHGGRSLVHGDVKTGNILLGDNLTPKVSDFGSSKLESIARHANWCVMGDMSYIDPVYIKTGRFTQKSDVYSFGVVLLELITRKTARYGNNNSLPVDFVKSCKEDGNGRMMYDRDIISSDGDAHSPRYVECLDQIGMLAVRCLREDKDERPSMAEVVEELIQLKFRARSATSCKTN
ncbi:hypothetical protein SETIT_2G114700v2 [Setaria italica]|uniref:Protein kinase domain-containing protein n=1 Tax=Setaria italica TaxID=4555 RepID=A0A368PXE9_SETIT|nr:wall-associated receptor kinase 2 [Setaria italica]RCV10467.1 hypothetical protein SETIT_2G114700v2 [Setaria italica]